MDEPQNTVPEAVVAKQRLLIAAEEVFAERGFTGASVRDITGRAGVNIAAINYYFGDKEKLYTEALKAAVECANDGPGFAPGLPEGTPPVEKLRGFIRFMTARMHATARPSAMRLVMREMAHPSAVAREVILNFIRPKAFLLRAIMEELLPGADPRRLLMCCFSVMGQILFYRQNRPVVELMFGKDQVDALGLELVTDHITSFTLAALGVQP